MCGIVGYTGNRNAIDVVFEGLKTLEYRGYDSAGIAAAGSELYVTKTLGRVANLKPKLPAFPIHTVIGHTRWATHGKPSEQNAHPHVSFDGKVAIVHNGIIENYAELKTSLSKQGIRFASDTDSEIIAHMLALRAGDDFLQAVIDVSRALKGSATFLAIRKGDDKIYCSKCGASLHVGHKAGESFATSDTLAVCDRLDEVIPLEDGDVAVLSVGGIQVFNGGKAVNRKAYRTSRNLPKHSKLYMRSEIDEIPRAVQNTLQAFSPHSHSLSFEKIKDAEKLYFVGCGTAFHACLFAKRIFSRLLKKSCEAIEASELDEALISNRDVAVFVTQSGETADTVLAAKRSKQAGAYTVAVCNVPNSLISFVADDTLYTRAGAEVAVAATKSYVCQLVLIYQLAKSIIGSPLSEKETDNLVESLSLATDLAAVTENAENKNLFFIGKGLDFVTAKEAALKVKEITYKMTDAYSAGELKHGPIALIDDSSLVFLIATNKADKSRIEATTSELRSRGATVVALSSVGEFGADKTLQLPALNDNNLYPALAIIPLQTLALELSLRLGLNPDKPRNLAKSVTVI